VTAINQNFEMINGDSTDIHIVIDEDLTGSIVKWLMHKNGLEIVSKESGNGNFVEVNEASESSVIKVRLDSADTVNVKSGVYRHECEIRDVDGNVSTVTMGIVNVKKGYIE